MPTKTPTAETPTADPEVLRERAIGHIAAALDDLAALRASGHRPQIVAVREALELGVMHRGLGTVLDVGTVYAQAATSRAFREAHRQDDDSALEQRRLIDAATGRKRERELAAQEDARRQQEAARRRLDVDHEAAALADSRAVRRRHADELAVLLAEPEAMAPNAQDDDRTRSRPGETLAAFIQRTAGEG